MPFARVPVNEIWTAKRVLDAGVFGVMFPFTSTPELARQAAAACRYPPHGRRGSGAGLAMFAWPEVESYHDCADENVVVIAIIEEARAVENIDEIAATPGIDVLFIGTSDLSFSLGLRGKQKEPKLQEAIARVVAAGKKHGKFLGRPAGTAAQIAEYREQGFQLFQTATDIGLMAQGAKSLFQSLGRTEDCRHLTVARSCARYTRVTPRARVRTAPWVAHDAHYKWYAVAMLWWIAFFNYADRQAIFSVFPLLKKEFASRSGAARPARLLIRVGLWFERSVRGRHRRPRAPQIGDPGRPARLEPHLHGHGALPQLQHAAFLPRRGRPGRNILFSGVDVAAERLSRSSHAFARARVASNQRLYRNHRRWFLRGLIGQRYGWRWSFVVFGGLGIVLGPGPQQMADRT